MALGKLSLRSRIRLVSLLVLLATAGLVARISASVMGPAASAVLGPPQRRRREVHASRPDGPLPTFTEYATADDEARDLLFRGTCAVLDYLGC